MSKQKTIIKDLPTGRKKIFQTKRGPEGRPNAYISLSDRFLGFLAIARAIAKFHF